MEQFKQIIRWPADQSSNRAPWYQVAWRTLWVIPAAAALLVYSVLVGIMYGPGAAEATWKDNI